MSSPMKSLALGTLLWLPLLAQTASAYYDPGVQRWLNRDPIGERGFEKARGSQRIDANNGANLYGFVESDPCNAVDSNGLQLWLCERKSTKPSSFPIGNHAYFWDDTGINPPCGMSDSLGNGTPGFPGHDTGPGTIGQACQPIAGTEDQTTADAIMQRCRDIANRGIYMFFINDCHNKIDRSLRPFHIRPPKHPRLGHPRVIPRSVSGIDSPFDPVPGL